MKLKQLSYVILGALSTNYDYTMMGFDANSNYDFMRCICRVYQID